jgi:hypothetical protein
VIAPCPRRAAAAQGVFLSDAGNVDTAGKLLSGSILSHLLSAPLSIFLRLAAALPHRLPDLDHFPALRRRRRGRADLSIPIPAISSSLSRTTVTHSRPVRVALSFFPAASKTPPPCPAGISFLLACFLFRNFYESRFGVGALRASYICVGIDRIFFASLFPLQEFLFFVSGSIARSTGRDQISTSICYDLCKFLTVCVGIVRLLQVKFARH